MAESPPGAVLIVGVGPGLGAALARRFTVAGCPVALGARSPGFIEELASELTKEGDRALAVPYDATDEADVHSAILKVREAFGPIGTLLYNVGNMRWGGLEKIDPKDFEAALRAGPYGAFLHGRELFPGMAEVGRGVAIFTGATSSVRAPAHSPAFAAAKFGLRGLALSLARAWSAKGVHIAHVLIDGRIRFEADSGEAAIEPGSIAEAYYQLAVQTPDAWTFEMDLRPSPDDLMDN